MIKLIQVLCIGSLWIQSIACSAIINQDIVRPIVFNQEGKVVTKLLVTFTRSTKQFLISYQHLFIVTLLIQIEANRIYTIISQKIQYQILSDNKSLLMTNNFHKEVCFVSIFYYLKARR